MRGRSPAKGEALRDFELELECATQHDRFHHPEEVVAHCKEPAGLSDPGGVLAGLADLRLDACERKAGKNEAVKNRFNTLVELEFH